MERCKGKKSTVVAKGMEKFLGELVGISKYKPWEAIHILAQI